MIAYFLLGLALLVGAILLLRWFVDAEPRQVLRALGWTAAALGVALALVLLFAGRHALGALLLPALLPILWRWRRIWQAVKSRGGPSPGRTSEVETRFLKMSLEHDTGVMTGLVREGSFAGARLEDLGLEDVVELWRECRAAGDEQSVAVLEAYLDRTQGADWRAAAGAEAAGAGGAGAGAGAGPPPGSGRMTEDEAYAILGLERGASAEEVRRAYRELIKKLHPDHGGSNYFASKLNEAKRLLIGE